MATMATSSFGRASDVCTVNDNAGQLFQFERLANGESWLTVTLWITRGSKAERSPTI